MHSLNEATISDQGSSFGKQVAHNHSDVLFLAHSGQMQQIIDGGQALEVGIYTYHCVKLDSVVDCSVCERRESSLAINIYQPDTDRA